MNVTVCVSPSRIVGKRFEMHEIPGIVFFPSGQTQQALQHCLFLHRDRADERARYLGKRSVVYFFSPLISELSSSTSFCTSAEDICSISAVIKSQLAPSIITPDSLQSSTWHGAFRALIISSSVVWHFYKSAASKWWWCECFSVLDRLWNELLYLHLAASVPSFFSNSG